jgi:hypothetical protein
MKVRLRHTMTVLMLLTACGSAHAHGIAGNRFFVGTLTFDDPAVADEAILPNFSTLNQSVEGGRAVDDRFDWSLTRLLTPVLQMQVDSGWIHRDWSTARTSGFATTDVGIKSEIYRDNQHEMLVSAGVLWGIGHSARKPLAPTSRIRFGPAFFSARVLAMCLTDWPGCDPSQLPARSSMNYRLAQHPPRLASVHRAASCKTCLFPLSKHCIGACPFNTAPIT